MRVALSNARCMRQVANRAVDHPQLDVPDIGVLHTFSDASLCVGRQGGSYDLKAAIVGTSFTDVLTECRAECLAALLRGAPRA